MVTLLSADNQSIQVDYDLINMSNTIRILVSDLDAMDAKVVRICKVDGDILKKVIVWMTYHKHDPEPEGMEVEISEWDQEFLNVDQSTLFKLIMAARFLEIKGLSNMACKTVADMMRNKTAQQIRDMFNIEDDLTSEEDE